MRFALRVSHGAADLTAADFRALTDHGFSQDDILEIIGFVAFWTFNIILTSSVSAALAAAPPAPPA